MAYRTTRRRERKEYEPPKIIGMPNVEVDVDTGEVISQPTQSKVEGGGPLTDYTQGRTPEKEVSPDTVESVPTAKLLWGVEDKGTVIGSDQPIKYMPGKTIQLPDPPKIEVAEPVEGEVTDRAIVDAKPYYVDQPSDETLPGYPKVFRSKRDKPIRSK